MADSMCTGSAKMSALLAVLGKLMANLTQEFLDHIPAAHGVQHNTMVSRDEWMLMFDYKGAAKAAKDVGPKPSAAKRLN